LADLEMTQRFTVDGGPELEQRLEQWCAQFAEDVRRIIPANSLEAIVLGGGYGRGEGGVLRTASGEAAYNDLEFYIFVRGPLVLRERQLKATIGELCHQWSEKTDVEFEAKLLTLKKIQQASVSMFYYDLVVGHRWLFGSAGEFRNCEHHRAAHRIPLNEATRLLMNRASGLLFSKALLEKGDFTPSDADFVRRNISKAQLALGDVVLTAFGRYHSSCRERHRRLEKLDADAAASWLPSLIAHHEIGVEFKLHPHTSSESVDQLRADHAAITNLAGEVFLWLEQRRLNAQFATHRDYAFSSIEKHPDRRRLRNALINLRAFGPRQVRSRYPRARLLESLALLLWTPSSISDPDARRKLQSDLVTDATTLTGFAEAYRRIWNRFN
jgi:hypothetical protein